MRPDGLKWKVWLIDPAGPGVADDREALRAFFQGLPKAWRPPVEVLGADGLGVTADMVVAALDEIAAFDGLRVLWIGGHTKPNKFRKPALYTDDPADGDRVSLSMGDLWEQLAEAAQANPLVAWVDVCEAAKPKRAEWPPTLAAIAASRPGQDAEALDGQGGRFTQALLLELTCGHCTLGGLAQAALKAARGLNLANTPWAHTGATVEHVPLAPDPCPKNAERLKPRHVLGHRYRLVDKLGRGAYSVVWRADDLRGAGQVAVKVLHSAWATSQERLDRFRRGAREMARLEHPNIVRVLDEGGESGGHHYFAMELIEGQDLHAAVTGRHLDRADAVRVAMEVGDALATAHRHGVVHRDVKPGNILVGQDGRALLTDFDLVRAADTKNGSQHSVGLGTWIYAAPELMESSRRATEKVDVFGLAMTTLFMWVGRKLGPRAFRSPEQLLETTQCPTPLRAVIVAGLDWDVSVRPELGTWLAQLAEHRAAADAAETDPVRPVSPLFEPGVDELPTFEWEKTPRQSAPQTPAEPGAGRVVHSKNSARPAMVYIPGGTQRLGPRDVTLSPFLMANTPVTQAQYQEVTGKNPSHFDGAPDSPERPVEQVSWHDAAAYCNALSVLDGLRPAYADGRLLPDAEGYRLPTEAQWEYACRAGATARYWSGDSEADLARVGWYNKNSDGSTYPVGAKQAPNPWGLHDMHGNVWEWCHDWYADDPPATPLVDPSDPFAGGDRIARGGSFDDSAVSARADLRGGGDPGGRDRRLGFRLVRPAPQRGPGA